MKKTVLITIILVTILSFLPTIDTHALKLLDASIERSFIAFGLAKALNGIVSLLQGTQLTLTPAGVGINLTVGEILDPFNDMVERFSWVMLLATISLGIQKLFLIIGSKLFFKIAIALCALITVMLLWFGNLRFIKGAQLAFKIFLLLIFIRFFAVIAIYSSTFSYDALLAQEYTKATKTVSSTKEYLHSFQQTNRTQVAKEEHSLSDYFSSKYNQLKESFDIEEKFMKLQDNIEKAYSSIINLITIFLVQTILFPLLFLWLLLVSFKQIFKLKLTD